MPSGRVHDRITGYLSPLAAVGAGAWGQRWELATLAAVVVLISGFFLSPDLDIHSRPYQRWGLLRWLWWPYQKLLPHRSFFSHGPVVGTLGRLGYLGAWGMVLLWGMQIVGQQTGWWTWAWQDGLEWLQHSWQQDSQAWVIGLISLEIGAMGHYLSDFWSSLTRKKARSRSSRS